MSIIITDTYSDQDMQCPAEWENGFKEARIIAAGDAERALSHPMTGDWTGSTFNFSISDYDRRFREQFASLTGRYWNNALTVRMTTRENRAILGTPYTVFVGPVVDAKPTKTLAWDVTLGDIVSQGLLSDQGQIPWRKIGDGPIDHPPFALSGFLDITAEHLDRDTPEPIIYGSHRRIPDVDPASPQGFCVLPPYLGQRIIGGDNWHVWLIAGHAVKDIPFWNVIDHDGVIASNGTEGGEWLVPHHAGYTAEFGGDYEDVLSVTYGNLRRYTFFYGKVTDLTADVDDLTDPDACALGHKQLTVAVDGIEDLGDGTGTLIEKRILQYQHFLMNFVANRGIDSYQSGPWLANPTWTVFDTTVPIVEEESFAAADAIADLRLPSPDVGSPAPGSPMLDTIGYIGAAVIGAQAGDIASSREWIAKWNRSCGLRFGVTHLGQLRVVMLSPTAAIKTAAQLYDDVNLILRDSFETNILWSDLATTIPYKGDYNHATGVFNTSGAFVWQSAIDLWGREIVGQERQYDFAPGITAIDHLARLEGILASQPLRTVRLEATIGPDRNNLSLGYLDLGDYIRVKHFDAVSNSATEIRLLQIVKHQVQAGARRVLVEAVDCDDLIGLGGGESYDQPGGFTPDNPDPDEGGGGDPGGPAPPTDLVVVEDP